MRLEKSKLKKILSISALSISCGVMFSAPASADDWPMFLKTPTHSPSVEKAPMPPYSLKWKFSTKGPVYSSPVVVNKKVYVGSHDKSLYALDAESGSLLWSFQTEGEVLSTPAVDKDKVFFGSKDGKIYALDASSGKLLWKYETEGGVMTSPIVAEDIVYAGSMDLYLYAINAADGKRRWRMKLPDYELYSGIYSSPAYSDGAIYAAGKNGFIYSMAAKSGGRNWSKRTQSAIYSSPAVSEGIIYIASYDRYIYALDSKTGKIIWKKNLGNDIVYSTPVVVGDRIYVGFKSGLIRAYGKTDGAEKADYKFPSEVNSTPVISGNGLMLAGCEDGYFYAVDIKTGSTAWRFRTNGGVHSSPAVLENAVYIGSEDGNIYAFSPESKK